jgi:hypothetical protein
MRSKHVPLPVLCLLLLPSLPALADSTVPPAPPASPAAPAFHASNAVLVNLTEDDLNGVLQELFAAAGDGRVSGEAEQVSKGLYDLRYDAELSRPELALGEGGRLSVRLAVRSADVRIGRIERRIGKRTARCENAGVRVDPERPLELAFDVRFDIGPDGLQLLPEAVSMDDARTDLRLVKPTRCENAILPRWLLWWIGKPKLRRKMESLDELLLERARSGAASLNGDSGLLAKKWESDDGETYRLFPSRVDTAADSLLLALDGSSDADATPASALPAWVGERRDGSFLALKGELLDRLAAFSFPAGEPEPRKPSGLVSKLFRSRSLYTLIPGLREVGNEDIQFSLRLTPPRISLASVAADSAGIDPTLLGEPASDAERGVLRIELSDVVLGIWHVSEERREVLGELVIESGRVAVAPYFSRIGGISFALLENEWRVSSSGLEFNEPVLAATLQEMVFGEIFETRFEPLARGALEIGDAELTGRGFRVLDDYLVIEVGARGAAETAPKRRDNLLASR